MTSRPRKEMADSRMGTTTHPTMDSSKHKDACGGEANKEVQSGESESNADTVTAPSSSIPVPQTHGDGASEGGSSSSSNNRSSSGGVSSGTSLSSSGMGNPFARAAPQATWSSETSEQRPILAPPRLSPASDSGGVRASSTTTTTTSSSSSSVGGVLRPSALSAGRLGGPVRAPGSFFSPPALTVTASSPPQPTKTEFKLKPSVLASSANPFGKSSKDNDIKNDAESGSSETDKSTSEQRLTSTGEDKTPENQTSPSSSQAESKGATNKINTSSNLFLPLGNGNDSSSSPTIAKSSFIFGHNLQSKITAGGGSSGSSTGGAWGVSSSADPSEATNGEKPTGNLFSEAASEVSRWTDGGSLGATAAVNGQPHTGNLFSDAASGITQSKDEGNWRDGPSLEESSREITEKEKSQKRKFDEVEVITGEENESNVLQMNCKLYAWVSGWWQERGRGILRLNDWDAGGQEIRSRLVIRTQGTLTVMLNTKVWAEMSVERASSKSVRFTALDADGQPKIFLAMGSPKDVDLLYNSLEWRVNTSRAQTHDDTAADAKKTKTDEDDAKAAPVTTHSV